MYSPRFVGQTLALCLPGLLALVPVVQSGARRLSLSRAGPEPARSVSIWHREAGGYRQSTDAPLVLQVRSLVERAMALQGPRLDTFRRAHAALSERYGARLTVSSALPPHYEWRWNPILEEWEIVCVTSHAMEIDFGRGGTVVVETHDGMSVE